MEEIDLRPGPLPRAPEWWRNTHGEVVHHRDCRRRGRTARPWYRAQEMTAAEVDDEVRRYRWLRWCAYCNPATRDARDVPA